jgi:hypothetical protein
MLHDKNTTNYVDELMSVAKVRRKSWFKKPLLTREEILERAIPEIEEEVSELQEYGVGERGASGVKIMYLIQHDNGSFVCGICENNRRDLYMRLDDETDPFGYTKFWFNPIPFEDAGQTYPLDSFQFEGCNTPNEEGTYWWTPNEEGTDWWTK